MDRLNRNVAIIGTGQTDHASRRDDVNLPGLVREAALRCAQDAGISLGEVDAFVLGSAPEVFEGVNQPEQWLVEALGGQFKPMMRLHTGGTVGASTGICACFHIASGLYDKVMAVSYEKLSDGVAQYGLSLCYDPLWGRDFAAGAPALAALQAREYMARFPYITEEHFARVAVKDRANAMLNKYAHVKKELTLEEVMSSAYVSTPLKMHDCCPTTDGAAAILFSSEEVARKKSDNPAWVHAVSTCAEGAYYPGMDIVRPRALLKATRELYDRAGISEPLKDLDMAELYCAFSPQEYIWLEAVGLAEEGRAVDLIESGKTAINGEFPINPSGGVLSTNPIGASALIRQVECALQVTGRAGEHQVPGVKKALAHSWGGWLQFYSLMIVGSEPPAG
ncbi:MAG: thiolase domain-containing protein [Actinobacteria bacterium]|nr:thiolase domain-containing protein [Actinomycetota bacterium]